MVSGLLGKSLPINANDEAQPRLYCHTKTAQIPLSPVSPAGVFHRSSLLKHCTRRRQGHWNRAATSTLEHHD